MRILLINNYDSYADLLAYTLGCVTGQQPTVLLNDALSADAILANSFDAIVVSPGPGHPAEPSDFGVCAEVIARCQVPLLGVCLGHQGIAMVQGGQVVQAEAVKHGKRSVIHHNGHALFKNVPSPLCAMRYHSWVVDGNNLPPTIEVLARAQDDNAVMAIALRHRPVMGVQFHPESVGTRWGKQILSNFVNMAAPKRTANANSAPPSAQQTHLKGHQRHPRGRPPEANAQPTRHIQYKALPWRDPEAVFERYYLYRPYAFWLDTAAPDSKQRWSMVGAPYQVLESYGSRLVQRMLASPSSEPGSDLDSSSGPSPSLQGGNPFTAWRRALAQASPLQGLDALPCPFAGGLVGHANYEMQQFGDDATCLAEHQRHHQYQHQHQHEQDHCPSPPDSVMQQCRRFLAFDHTKQRVYAVAVHTAAAKDTDNAAAWLRNIRQDWHKRWPSRHAFNSQGDCPPGQYWPPHISARIDPEGYARRIAQAQAHIQRGDIYEICLTNLFTSPTPIDPWHLYRILRHTHPAPYAAFLKGPRTNILSASPERFLTLSRTGHITTEPIKGTRAHAGTRGSQRFQSRQLRHSPKDQSELLMIVDLLRNDLARVAKQDTLQVRNLFELTRHPTVIQMSARITAQLSPQRDAIDLLKACFPGGSITGAPKRRAMQIINALEARSRGPYTGAIGYLCNSGAMNLNIAIRTMTQNATGISFGAGGAITTDSDPQAECEEVEAKAFALARAVALAQDGECGEMRLERIS